MSNGMTAEEFKLFLEIRQLKNHIRRVPRRRIVRRERLREKLQRLEADMLALVIARS